ncbi:GAF and ANTAR domain-containing protein [Kribbella sp. NPDC056861]|uniref:GAF and ANTAR domain-containing protein n=1 Tax=Kribbella sp. NPDC056861 TaxID=3154857 RepID=UPI003440F84F
MTDQARSFGEMAMNLHNQTGVAATVGTVLEFATEVLHYDAASVMLMHHKRAETIAATDPLVTLADQLQIDLGEGPSLLAVSQGDNVLVKDTGTDDRWPKWAPTAAENGIRSALAIRLVTAHSTSGVLNLISTKPYLFGEGDLEAAELLALHASIAIAAVRTEVSLNNAIDSRKLVGQAVGRLMERYKVDAIQAYTLMQRYSQNRNQRLNTVAQHVVTTGDLPT